MKYLILLLLISSTSFAGISDRETQQIISELKKGNYKILDFYYSRESASPFIKLQNGQIYIKQYASYLNKEHITKAFSFKNNGKTFIYKNKYNLRFVNDEEVLLTLDEIKSMPNSECFGFSQLMEKAYSATNYTQIQQLYQEFFGEDLSLYYLIVKSHYYDLFKPFIKDYLKISAEDVFSKLEIDNIVNGIFNIVYSSEEQKRIVYLNMVLSQILTDYYDGHPYLTVPNHQIVRSTLPRNTELYKCFDEPHEPGLIRRILP